MNRCYTYLRYASIGLFLLGVFFLPLGLIMYGGGGMAMFGGSIIVGLIVLQWPIFMFLKWLGLFRENGRGDRK